MAPDWIALDWGTTNLRAWAMQGKEVVDRVSAPIGMGMLKPEEFEPALISAIGRWLDAKATTPVIACGMVGARQGWAEAAYVAVPSAPIVAGRMRRVQSADRRIALSIVHGLCQETPPDVMRGEETQIAGLIGHEPDFSGIVCLPGTHTKWAEVRAGRIAAFRTFMSGELFSLLASHSVLRHSVGQGPVDDLDTFDAAVAEAARAPSALTSTLFSIRAGGLLAAVSADAARARLSGLLIGAEIEAQRRRWQGGTVAVIGGENLAGLYERAICLGGGAARRLDGEAMTLSGLLAARKLQDAEEKE